MRLLATICVACWSTCASVHAAASPESVAIRLRPTVVLAAPHATLADLAELSGSPAAVAALEKIVVQDLRAVPVLVEESLIRVRIAKQAPDVAVTITGQTLVSQPLRTISVDAQVQAATAVLVHAGEDVEIVMQRASGPLTIADDGTAPVIDATPLDRGRVGDVAFRVRLMRGEDELARSLVVLRVRRYARVVVLATDVRRGAVLGAGDLTVQRVELSTMTQDAFSDPNLALGFQVTRDATAGQILTPTLALAPLAVRPGQGVTLVWRTGSVELSALGEALAGGRDGEIIGVKRASDQQRVRGQIIGRGKVLINF